MTRRPVFLMTDPGHYDVSYSINPWMRPDSWAADPDLGGRAQRASTELREALVSAGADVEIVPPAKGLPDLVFPANAAVVLDGRALLARFMHPERQGEETIFAECFESLAARGLIDEIHTLPEDLLHEGAGDAIWDRDRHFFWAGFGQRSDRSSIDVIEDVFEQHAVPLELASPRFYHLDTCFCPLEGGRVLYYPAAFTRDALATIEACIAPKDRIIATDADAAAFCVNAVNIGERIIMAKAPKSLKSKLEQRGYIVDEVDLSPFILSGGGAYCMTLRLDRTTKRAAVRTPVPAE
jgi:N-dimethylarginine dimethylaminohydrolase